ncbi:MAG: outer-membrane lipoprotein carrier protein LolA [Campylobacterales bacterium]|nr:outer-membrane lipoprotein carrier protein LolA [Campylobacterales bacterium]
MHLFLLLLCTALHLSAFPIALETLQADFTQTITDEHNQSVVYEGKLKAVKPSIAHWSYTKPIRKEIYIHNERVVIVEPELEQAIVREITEDIDIFAILQNAKQRSSKHYEAEFNERGYHIYITPNTLSEIRYVDDFANTTRIVFSNVIHNAPLDPATLEAVIPKGFDQIR